MTSTKVLLVVTAAAAISVPFLVRERPTVALSETKPATPAPVVSRLQPSKAKSVSASPPDQSITLDQVLQEAQAPLDDQAVILAEFRRLGGSITESYVDNDIAKIIQQDFGGDRAAFERDLQKKEKSLEQFRKERLDMMIVSVMKARALQGVTTTDRVERERIVQEWIASLRLKASAGGAKPKSGPGDF